MHRRQIRTWLFSVLFFSALSVTAFAEQAIVTGEEVNVRSGPGLVYSSFTSLREGMTVEVLNRSNADWYQVSWDGNVGYVSSAYLRLSEEAAGSAAPGITGNSPEAVPTAPTAEDSVRLAPCSGTFTSPVPMLFPITVVTFCGPEMGMPP